MAALLPAGDARHEVKLRTNRRIYLLPRQLAMYIAKQLTDATLHEFGSRHHSTALRSISRIEAMRRSDVALNWTVTQMVDAVATQT